MPTFTLFVPVLNELACMKVIMPTIPPNLFTQILIVDGQSTDGTAQWCQEQGYEVYVQKQRGLRAAYVESWPLIKGDYVITFSPDGNCKVEDFSLIIGKLKEGYEMVIGSRYCKGSHSDDDDMLTGFGNWLFTTTINLSHGGHYTDAMTIFRGYRTSLFYELDIDKEDAYVPEKYFYTLIGIEPLLSVRAAKAKIKTIDVPSIEPARIEGKRKLQIVRWGLAYMTQVLREIYFWNPKTKRA